jgi:hypothetical protein
MSRTIDHGWARERDQGNGGAGNRGAGITVAISDVDPARHLTRMRARLSRIVPDANAIAVNTHHTSIRTAAEMGAAVIAIPWIQPSITRELYDTLSWCAANQVLLFAGSGNDNSETWWPACHPDVFACVSGKPDGTIHERGSPPLGKVDVVMIGDELSSGSTADAAAIAAQWLGYAVHMYRNGGRRDAFRLWLETQGIKAERGYFPCWRT